MSNGSEMPSSPSTPTASGPTYPMPAFLNFCPGGVSCVDNPEASFNLAAYSQTPNSSSGHGGSTPRSARRGVQSPDPLVYKAKIADDRLRQYILLHGAGDPSLPYFLPSLSCLAHAAFGRLTGVPPGAAKTWADSMVLQYLDGSSDTIPQSEEDIQSTKPTAMRAVNDTTVNVLKRLLQEGEAQQDANDISSPNYRPRPCGYVFKRGDIAWNCRTCQTDSTCVICDNCFRNSKHDGHEVYFHRTTPGGCCDCGDAEAWKLGGCCDAHRPQVDTNVEVSGDDPEEAVRMANKGLQEGLETLSHAPTQLPPKLAASLGVVIGAAVNCMIQAVDGAGIGADPSQWKLRWTDEASRIWNGAARNEDYHLQKSSVTPNDFLGSNESPRAFPQNYRLHLRLHNDDVHTFDEVIDALHEPRHARRASSNNEDGQSHSLVTLREAANEMTHHVDADGQVSVKTYSTIATAMQGYRRLKSRGLHCAVVSTSQVDVEQRARTLSSWLSEISAAHPSAAVLVVHALVQASCQHSLRGVSVWSEVRMIPPWASLNQPDDAQACRKRFQAFPPHLSSSYVSSEESEKLHEMALQMDAAAFVELAGKSQIGGFLIAVCSWFIELLTSSRTFCRHRPRILQCRSLSPPIRTLPKVAPCAMGYIAVALYRSSPPGRKASTFVSPYVRTVRHYSSSHEE